MTNLTPGHVLVNCELNFSTEDVRNYIKAVGDTSPVYKNNDILPPMAVAAFALTTAMEAVDLPAGAVHFGQELEFSKPANLTTSFRCNVTITENSVRGDNRFMGLQFAVTSEGDAFVIGRTNLILPAKAANP